VGVFVQDFGSPLQLVVLHVQLLLVLLLLVPQLLQLLLLPLLLLLLLPLLLLQLVQLLLLLVLELLLVHQLVLLVPLLVLDPQQLPRFFLVCRPPSLFVHLNLNLGHPLAEPCPIFVVVLLLCLV
jgi:hypothetical protein